MELTKLKTLMGGPKSKTWIVLIVALGLGVLAAIGARTYFVGRMADIDARSRGQMVSVVVARTDLPRGTKLSAENVAIRQVPQEYAHSVAVMPNEFDKVEGQPLSYSVKAGEMILWGLMEGKRTPTFSARVENGRRAITVPVDEITSISGMLEPGDVIDLMVTMNQKDGRKITFPLLQSVLVMATGQRVVDDPKSGERRSYSTVTLDTTPEQAQYVIVGRDSGRITALLRNPQDKKPLANTGGDVAVLLGMKDGAAISLPDGAQVPVMYGGSGGRFPPEALQLGQSVNAAGEARSAGDSSRAGSAAASEGTAAAMVTNAREGTGSAPMPAPARTAHGTSP